MLMHDEAKDHTYRAAVQYLQQHSIRVLQWPYKLPDLNLIEHLCYQLNKRVRKLANPLQNLRELEQVLVQKLVRGTFGIV